MHHLAADEALALLGTDPVDGLSSGEAERRLALHGLNVLPRPRRRGPLLRLALQFHNPLIYVLVAAAAITAAIGHFVDAAVIAGVVVINAVIGFVQESRAERALEALLAVARTQAVLVRDGRRRVVDSEVLVPGDLVHLEAGDRVPADVRLLWVREAGVDESMLTGESVPAAKGVLPLPADTLVADRANMAFAGTLVTSGRAEGVVVATGRQTELGRIHLLVGQAADLDTPLTRRIGEFSRVLTVAIMALAAVTFTLGLARGEPSTEMFIAAVALAVGAIPEGLPAAVTITLAVGVSRMARRRAIVRRLPAAETLGSTTVICTDKTGTLTQNRMVVRALWACGHRYRLEGEGYSPAGALAGEAGAPADDARPCLTTGVLCNDARLREEDGRWSLVGDPTEGALLAAAERAGIGAEKLRAAHPRLDAIPFASERGWMATLTAAPAGPQVHVKGAVERVLELCSAALGTGGAPGPLDPGLVRREAADLAAEGMRVLATAGTALPPGATALDPGAMPALVLTGLLAMQDPPRPEAVAAVAECRRAGIAVKMITGDQLETARAIARQVGLTSPGAEPRAISGAELEASDPQALPDLVGATDVFARVSPEQKLRLVTGLQRRGEVVAMTGDGVNDAPALRQADLGIAMGRDGTEVAKEAADIVLADDDFATVGAAVEEGRRVFDNLTKFIVWTLPTNFGEGLVILTAILLGATLPIVPTQILWINMTTAVALGLPLAFERLERDAMLRPPRDPDQPLLTAELIARILLVSGLLLAGAYGLHAYELGIGAGEAEARTVAVNVFVFGEAVYLLNCRSLERAFTSMGLLSNRWVIVGLGTMGVLQLAFTYLPAMQELFGTADIGPASWARIVAVGVMIGMAVGGEKLLRRRRRARRPRPRPRLRAGLPT